MIVLSQDGRESTRGASTTPTTLVINPWLKGSVRQLKLFVEFVVFSIHMEEKKHLDSSQKKETLSGRDTSFSLLPWGLHTHSWPNTASILVSVNDSWPLKCGNTCGGKHSKFCFFPMITVQFNRLLILNDMKCIMSSSTNTPLSMGKLSDEAFKASFNQLTYWGHWFYYALLMPISCPAGCNSVTPDEEEMKQSLGSLFTTPPPPSPTFWTRRATVFMLLVEVSRHTLFTISIPSNLIYFWSDKCPVHLKERHVISVWIQQSWGILSNFVMEVLRCRACQHLRGLRPLGEWCYYSSPQAHVTARWPEIRHAG